MTVWKWKDWSLRSMRSKEHFIGVCYTEFAGDHVSYLLNSDAYKVEAFDMTDTPKNILRVLLSGTPFTVGDVDPTEEVTPESIERNPKSLCHAISSTHRL